MGIEGRCSLVKYMGSGPKQSSLTSAQGPFCASPYVTTRSMLYERLILNEEVNGLSHPTSGQSFPILEPGTPPLPLATFCPSQIVTPFSCYAQPRGALSKLQNERAGLRPTSQLQRLFSLGRRTNRRPLDRSMCALPPNPCSTCSV